MKETNVKILASSLFAIAIIILGLFIYLGLQTFANKERVITVRGLAEKIVDVNSANFTIKYVVGGNEMSEVLREIEQNNAKIVKFVKSKGLTENEISIGVPNIKDKKNQAYGNESYLTRYYATVKISLMSEKVEEVRDIEVSQFDLYKEGINLTTENEYYDYYTNNSGYNFTKLNDIKPQMIQESIKNAEKAANEFAQVSNAKIKGIKSAYQGQFEIIQTDDPLKVKVRVVSTINYFVK